MDLTELPFDVPIILHSLHTSKNLQNPLGSTKARCLGDTRDTYEQLILRRVRDDKVAIQCARNERFLKVQSAGSCVFDLKEPGETELFTMETNDSCSLFFVSCQTGNVLKCDNDGVAKCDNTNRHKWESWRILEPRSPAPPPSVGKTGHGSTVKDRQEFVLQLVKAGKSVDEIQQLVALLFNELEMPMVDSAFAVLVDKE